MQKRTLASNLGLYAFAGGASSSAFSAWLRRLRYLMAARRPNVPFREPLAYFTALIG